MCVEDEFNGVEIVDGLYGFSLFFFGVFGEIDFGLVVWECFVFVCGEGFSDDVEVVFCYCWW